MARKDLLEQTETRQGKKIWVAPEILDSPVIEVTEAGSTNLPTDGETAYS